MKLLKLDVEGYRSLKKVSWTPGDLNVLIGPNASGKTNLIRIIELLSIAAQGKLAKYISREGGAPSMLWDGGPGSLKIAIETTPVELASVSSLPPDLAALQPPEWWTPEFWDRMCHYYGLEFNTFSDDPWLHISRELLGVGPDPQVDAETDSIDLLQRDVRHQEILNHMTGEFSNMEGEWDKNETLLSVARSPFPINPVVSQFREALASWCTYSDVWVGRDAKVRQAPITSRQTRVLPDGENLLQVLHTLYELNREFRREVDLAMNAAFGEDFERLSIGPAPGADQRIQLQIYWKNLKRPVPAADLSDGMLRFLFLLAVLANPDPPPLIAIEEPEIGLHPSMLPIVAEFAVQASTRTQVIFTTHSPDFLDAFRDEAPTTTVFHWHEGQTLLGTLFGEELQKWLEFYRLGEYLRSGEFDNWLRDRLSDEDDDGDEREFVR